MKKLFLSLFLTSALGLSAQSTLNIFNYTTYKLSNYLVGSNPSNNCYPSITGTHYPLFVDPGGSVSYTGYYNAHLQNPPINSWTVQLTSTSGSSTQTSGVSPVLIPLATTTKWQMNKFFVEDPSGASLYWSGASIGTLSCGTPTITDLLPTTTTPYPFSAFWFEVGNDTYFIIQ